MGHNQKLKHTGKRVSGGEEMAKASAGGMLNLQLPFPWQILCVCCIRSFFIATYVCPRGLKVWCCIGLGTWVGSWESKRCQLKELNISQFSLPSYSLHLQIYLFLNMIHFCITRYNNEIIAGTSSSLQCVISDNKHQKSSLFPKDPMCRALTCSTIKKPVGYMSLT